MLSSGYKRVVQSGELVDKRILMYFPLQTILRSFATAGCARTNFVTNRRLIRRFPTVFRGGSGVSVSGG